MSSTQRCFSLGTFSGQTIYSEVLGPLDATEAAQHYFATPPHALFTTPSYRLTAEFISNADFEDMLFQLRPATNINYKHDIVYTWMKGAAASLLIPPGEHPTHALSNTSPREWKLYVRDPNVAGSETVRWMRSALRWEMLTRGGIPMHAGAFATDGGAHLVVGHSGGGKTSFCVHAACKGATYLSNDQTWLLPDGGNWKAVAEPTAVRLGEGLVRSLAERWFPPLHPLRPSPQWWPLRKHSNPLLWGSKDKLELTPAELCAATGTHFSHSAKLCTVLEVMLKPGPSRCDIRELSAQEASDALARHTLWPSSKHPESYFGDTPEPDFELFQDIPRQVPFFRVSGDATRAPEFIEEFLHRA